MQSIKDLFGCRFKRNTCFLSQDSEMILSLCVSSVSHRTDIALKSKIKCNFLMASTA